MGLPIYDERGCQECPHRMIPEDQALQHITSEVQICHMNPSKKCVGYLRSEKLVSEGKKTYNGDFVRVTIHESM